EAGRTLRVLQPRAVAAQALHLLVVLQAQAEAALAAAEVAVRERAGHAQRAARVDRHAGQVEVQALGRGLVGTRAGAAQAPGTVVGTEVGDAQLAAADGDVVGTGTHAVHLHEEGVQDVDVSTAVEALADPEVRVGRDVEALGFNVHLLEGARRAAGV